MTRRKPTKDIERLLREVARKPMSWAPHGPDCLTVEEFADFCAGRLTGESLEKVTRHLESCGTCLRETCLALAELGEQKPETADVPSAEGLTITRTALGCIPFLDLYRHVFSAVPLTDDQQRHLGTCEPCTRLCSTIRQGLAEEGLTRERLHENIAVLIREFVEQFRSQFTPYVDIVQTLVNRFVSSPEVGAPDEWRIGRRAELGGALSAAGLPDPEQMALLASAFTIAAVATVVSFHGAADPKYVEDVTRRFARKFRVERELADNLADFLSSRSKSISQSREGTK